MTACLALAFPLPLRIGMAKTPASTVRIGKLALGRVLIACKQGA